MTRCTMRPMLSACRRWRRTCPLLVSGRNSGSPGRMPAWRTQRLMARNAQWAGTRRYEHTLDRAGRRLAAQQNDLCVPWCNGKPAASAAGLHPIERGGFGAAQGGAVQDREQRAIAQAGWSGLQRRKDFAQESACKGLGLPRGARMHAPDASQGQGQIGMGPIEGQASHLVRKGDGGQADIDGGQRGVVTCALGQVGGNPDRLGRQASAALDAAPPVEGAPLRGVGPSRVVGPRLAHVVAQEAQDVGRQSVGAYQVRQDQFRNIHSLYGLSYRKTSSKQGKSSWRWIRSDKWSYPMQ